MKKTALISAVIFALLLTGCTDNGASDSDSSTQSTSQTESNDMSSTSQDESSEVSDENSTKLVGLAGDRISKSDITQSFNSDGNADYSDEAFQSAVCDGFVYLAEPSLTSLNSIDNADTFDDSTKTFANLPADKLKNYKRVNIGDTISGLTVTAATTNFSAESMDGYDKNALSESFPEIYFSAGSCELSGELTMTGYACVIPEDEYGIEAGTILFVPSGECPLPVMSYTSDDLDGVYHCANIGMRGDLTWASEYGRISLGNVNSATADISDLPTDGSFIKATVTVDSIKLSSGVNFTNIATSEIIEIRTE